MSTNKKTDSTGASPVETKAETLHAVTSKPSNFGQFAYTVTAKLTFDQILERVKEGLLHIAQRAPASRVEKTLVGYNKRSDMGSSWERGDIAYTDDLARKFETELAREIEKVAHIKVSVSASKYEGGEEREPAYAEAKKIVKRASAYGQNALAKLASNVGYTDGGELNVDNVEFVRAVEADRQRRADAMFS